MVTKIKKPEQCFVSVAARVRVMERSSKRKPARITFESQPGSIGHEAFEKLVDTLMKQTMGGYFGPVNVRGLELRYADWTGVDG